MILLNLVILANLAIQVILVNMVILMILANLVTLVNPVILVILVVNLVSYLISLNSLILDKYSICWVF